MANKSGKGKGKFGFGMTRRQKLDRLHIDYMNRKRNNDLVAAKRSTRA